MGTRPQATAASSDPERQPTPCRSDDPVADEAARSPSPGDLSSMRWLRACSRTGRAIAANLLKADGGLRVTDYEVAIADATAHDDEADHQTDPDGGPSAVAVRPRRLGRRLRRAVKPTTSDSGGFEKVIGLSPDQRHEALRQQAADGGTDTLH